MNHHLGVTKRQLHLKNGRIDDVTVGGLLNVTLILLLRDLIFYYASSDTWLLLLQLPIHNTKTRRPGSIFSLLYAGSFPWLLVSHVFVFITL